MRFLLLLTALSGLVAHADPCPGDTFREFTYGRRFSELDLDSKRQGIDNLRRASRQDRVLELPGLGSVAKAEISIEYWGGHIGTSGQKFQVNGGAWIDVPQPEGTPGKPQCYYRTLLGRATVQLPLEQLKEGRNVFHFSAGPQLCHGFDWGFWWIYSFTVRLYSKPGAGPHPGRIVSPADGEEIGENPRLVAEAFKPENPISSVEFIGKYEDFNWEGDGRFDQWHYITQRGQLRRHIGTVTAAPYAVPWDTAWVPDQPRPVELAARITDADGNIYITAPVKVRFRRHGRSVRMYKALDVPEGFAVRVKRKQECKFNVTDDLSHARAARIVLSTWSAAHGDEIGLNGSKLVDRVGLVHNYSFDAIPVPLRTLKPGANVFHIYSATQEHALEVNWPGPVLLVEYGEPEPKPAAAAMWLDPQFARRISLEVHPGGVERFDAIAEAALAEPPARLVELAPDATVKDAAVPFQFDRGSLTFIMQGHTGPEQVRRYQVYLGAAPPPSSIAPVKVTADIDCAGQKSLRIQTPEATYCFQKEGAAFASIADSSGREWIGYHPGGRATGEFRGIPNLGDDFGHPGHHGPNGSDTRLLAGGPLKATILSESHDRQWATQWDIYPTHARMTMLRHPKPYWFLYEGTPAGALDLANGFQVTSQALRRTLAEPWSGDLPAPEWIYFGTPDSPQVLFLVKHEDDSQPEQYWPMDKSMTVFGFGREYRCCRAYLNTAPAHFTLGLVANGSFNAVRAKIESAWREMRVALGPVERR